MKAYKVISSFRSGRCTETLFRRRNAAKKFCNDKQVLLMHRIAGATLEISEIRVTFSEWICI